MAHTASARESRMARPEAMTVRTRACAAAASAINAAAADLASLARATVVSGSGERSIQLISLMCVPGQRTPGATAETAAGDGKVPGSLASLRQQSGLSRHEALRRRHA